ncbi:MAG: DNA topoisomerase (ATP-hydrolyzing) subunit B [Patescibacteria group bacterium]|nr:DNA topoisomerase (ATP-hydrolyzing) subunit B [Patescibacteria group bacterium]
MASAKEASKKYTAESIQVLEGLEPVRLRPGMYIGSTGIAGLHHMVWEVLDNAVDEAMAGFATEVLVEVLPNDRVAVTDNGRGIPIGKHKVTGKSALETVLTVLHAGGKFGGEGYKVSGGLHGVGVSVVNALSTYLRAEVKVDGKLYSQEYKVGHATGKLKEEGKATGTGTKIIFQPDTSIFETTKFSFKTISEHCRQTAYLNRGLNITVVDLREEVESENEDEFGKKGKVKYPKKKETYYFEGGVSSYVLHINKNKDQLNYPPFYVIKAVDAMTIEVAIQYTDAFNENVLSFANNIYTPDGGMHLTGFRTALTRALNDYARKAGLLKDNDDNLSGDDVREGLTAILSIKLPSPQFEGQTKAKLGNPEARTAVDSVVAEGLTIYLEENPAEAKKMIEKNVLAARARLAAKAARDTVIRKGALEGMTLPGKLADCSSKKAEECELYIVEGDSAGGSAKQGRDRNFQAILPLRGKILNVERARLDRMLASTEIRALIVALGVGIGDTYDDSRLRYDRIIIMTDADVDGAHIRSLLLTFFFRHMTSLVNDGHVYIAQPPLYKITKGKESKYAYADDEKEQIVAEMLEKAEAEAKDKKGKKEDESVGAEDLQPEEVVEVSESEEGEEVVEDKKKGPKINIQRYKGLGEMNPEQLWETTMEPKNRILLRVSVDDAAKADEVFSTLMGDEVPPRKRFIQAHAKSVKNLDI